MSHSHLCPKSSHDHQRHLHTSFFFFLIVLGLVPPYVFLALRDAVSRSFVDDFRTIWSKSGEAGLFRAYCGAGGPTEAGSSAFIGRGLLRIRSRRLGGRTVGRSGSLADRTGSAIVMRLMFNLHRYFVNLLLSRTGTPFS